MIHSFIYSFGMSVTVADIPSANYEVYIYTWEDNRSETYSLKLEGVTVASSVVSGAAGEWKKLGPYRVSILDGALNLTSTGGAFNLSGIEIHTVGTAPGPVPGPAPTPTPTAGFYKGINVNGSRVSIGGNQFLTTSEGKLTHNGSPFVNNSVTLKPSTDSTTASMIQSSIYRSGLTVKLSEIPNATYDVYIYTWEDNRSETYSLKLEDITVANSIASGNAGEWKKLGPYRVSVQDGSLDLVSSGGAFNLSGIEMHTVSGSTPTPGPAPTPTPPAPAPAPGNIGAVVHKGSESPRSGPSINLNRGKIKVHNNRYLAFEDGTPFFYLADTAWELFRKARLMKWISI